MVLLIVGNSFSQNYEDQWKGFFSYVSVKSISQGNDKIFVGAENAVFILDRTTQEIKTLTTINGLSGEFISTIYYSELYGALFIGYENGLIDVVIDGEDDVLKVVDIFEKPTIPPTTKRINHFNEYEGVLYIATQYGISVYDIANLEFGDTYFIGDLGAQINITETTVLAPYLYASSSQEGIKRALVDNENLINYEEWEPVAGGNVQHIQALGDEIYYARNDNKVYRFAPFNPTLVATYSSNVVAFNFSKEGVLSIATEKSVYAYTDGFSLVASVNGFGGLEYTLQTGLAFESNFYLGTTEEGMYIVPFGASTYRHILPDGPLKNSPFALDTSSSELWVAFGDISFFNPYPLSYFGISNLKDETWVNIGEDNLFGASDLVHVKINPLNPNEVYFSSYQQGLLKVVNQVPEILYNEGNSALEEAILDNGDNAGIRIFGAAFDRENNLWFNQSRIDKGLVKLSPTGQFQRIDISPIIDGSNEQALNKLAISREGFVFFGSAENGLFGYNPTTGAFGKISEGEGQGGLPSVDVRALAFDASNRLWIGTRKGLRVLFSAGAFFDPSSNVESQQIIILEDGVPQELLYQQTITDIEVDGSNNKWIATATSGVFYVSSNGQETLLRFTKDNSPLPSNNVQDVAIDDLTGRVYFATVNGLVAYEGTATAPRDNLDGVYAFPNPVRPGFTGNVTIDGLTSNANVKITDIEGNLVFETTSQGGSVLWDTKAFGKYKVASGVYMVLITSADYLETKVTKIMVVR
ncbi:MAG: two-component regulator propeller domain-containing protein [Flavobacteriaceae bacterium]